MTYHERFLFSFPCFTSMPSKVFYKTLSMRTACPYATLFQQKVFLFRLKPFDFFDQYVIIDKLSF